MDERFPPPQAPQRTDILYEVRYFSNNHEGGPYTQTLPKPIEEYEKPVSTAEEPSVMRVIYNRGTSFDNKDKIAAAAMAAGSPSVSPMERAASENTSTRQGLRDRASKGPPADAIVLPPSNKRNMTLLEILSPPVQEVIRNAVDYYPDLPDVHQPLKLCWPWPALGHCDETLKEYQKDFEQRQCLEKSCAGRYLHRHIGVVRDYFREAHGDALVQEVERNTRGVATFNFLWYLLRPGEDVLYDRHDINEYEPYVIRSVEWVAAEGSIVSYSITLWHMDSNSYDMGPAVCSLELHKFSGEKPITSLLLFPFKYLEKDKYGRSQDEARREMEKRGELFFKLRRKGCWDFRGWSMTFPRRPFEGLVMVDPIQYQNDMGTEKVILDTNFEAEDRGTRAFDGCCKECQAILDARQKKFRFAGYSKINPLKVESLTPHQYFLCATTVEAFFIKHREWRLLHVSGFKPMATDKKMLDTLVLEPHIKNMINGLTRKYLEGLRADEDLEENIQGFKISDVSALSENHHWSADFVKGKGEGLIFLLHGKPGVGKTYTAECIAADANRPLLTLTSADIGTNSHIVEQNLMRWFKLATSWKAIMLIDEADIYMEHRKVQDLERNNLVASFLRAMEYYKGILFLTTNRVGTFDEAFLSRINLTIYYPPFSAKDREAVWESFFSKLERERDDKMRIQQSTRDYVAEATEILDLKWNGREIRNAFQTAVALAEVEGDTDQRGRILIKKEHIRATVDMARAFKKYMKDLNRKDDDAMATARGNRFDSIYYEKSPQPETPIK